MHASILIFFTMTIFFGVSIWKKDNSVADIGWAIGFMQIALYLFYKNPAPGTLQYVATIFILLWGIRLTTHITHRNVQIGEDPRYRTWRTQWKAHGTVYFYVRSFLQIFMLHGLILVIVSMPIIAINSTTINTELNTYAMLGIMIWIIGFLFEIVADYQLEQFKRTNINPNMIMMKGLWRYSRHPNYFGESLMWWGLWIMSLETSYGPYALISPITITLLLLFVSGVPMAEASLVHIPAFAQYKKRTSKFIPWMPRRISS